MKFILAISLLLCGCLPADYPLKPWHYSFSPLDDSVYVRKGNGWVLMSVDSTGVDWKAYDRHRDSVKRINRFNRKHKNWVDASKATVTETDSIWIPRVNDYDYYRLIGQ